MSKFPSHVQIYNFSLFPSLGLIQALKYRLGKSGGNLLTSLFFLKILFIFFMKDAQRERDTQAEGEAGSMQGA